MKKSVLGKGLNAIIPENHIEEIKEIAQNKGPEEIEMHLIKPKQDQPRKNFEKERLEELSESIKAHGLLQPIILRKIEKGYEIVAGERRWRAANMAGLKKIPALIRDFTDQGASEVALIENLQREDLNQIEEALALNDLMKLYGFTQETLAKKINKSRTYVTNTLRLLKLDPMIIAWITKGQISAGHGRALLAIEEAELQRKAADEVAKRGLSVRKTEDLVKNLLRVAPKKKTVQKAPHLKEIEEDLTERLGTKVLLKHGDKKGKIEIEYYGEEELHRIFSWFSKQ